MMGQGPSSHFCPCGLRRGEPQGAPSTEVSGDGPCGAVPPTARFLGIGAGPIVYLCCALLTRKLRVALKRDTGDNNRWVVSAFGEIYGMSSIYTKNSPKETT